ncbi:hypothetical protein KL911_005037 [Ogataea haglerorum]|uniref:uncharacterized protein n=1 Tax=Ogataea haglerorum TaxID=1937702 RepID=UPI001C89F5F1|nr:uncharacterized protein KL911_005037 [Ogataea haglerorum]KAG7749830.1 hypothetical protein KL911_005037 [Ogataea haglerorum]
MNPPDLCPICLDDLPDQDQIIVRETRSAQHLARTVPCHHYYHGFCINEWAQKANSCPQCRATFTDIELISDNNVYQSNPVPDRKQTPEPFEPVVESTSLHQHSHLNNQLCCLCDRSGAGAFAICRECSSGYHTACLGVIEGAQFHCPVCDSLQDASSVIPSRGGRRGQTFLQSVRRQIRNGRQRQLGVYVSRDEPDYVALVDEQRSKQTVTTEDIAWRALDALPQQAAGRPCARGNAVCPELYAEIAYPGASATAKAEKAGVVFYQVYTGEQGGVAPPVRARFRPCGVCCVAEQGCGAGRARGRGETTVRRICAASERAGPADGAADGGGVRCYGGRDGCKTA